MITRDGLTDDEFCYLVRTNALAILGVEPAYPIVIPSNSDLKAHERLASILPYAMRHVGAKKMLPYLPANQMDRLSTLSNKMMKAQNAKLPKRPNLLCRLRKLFEPASTARMNKLELRVAVLEFNAKLTPPKILTDGAAQPE